MQETRALRAPVVRGLAFYALRASVSVEPFVWGGACGLQRRCLVRGVVCQRTRVDMVHVTFGMDCVSELRKRAARQRALKELAPSGPAHDGQGAAASAPRTAGTPGFRCRSARTRCR
ncbi:hypothetical protein GCM10009549_43360 [Streptomyces thermoalcalitolerans]|uniref:Uncharacterized protein n=1 Tax=Streptomyces thermoalcalitolerans TaxID=65605 RepID=A0ABP3ZJR4_9ACTN